MGFFKKIFSALKKTKDTIASKISSLFSSHKIGEEFYEELEEILISSDISLQTSSDIVEELRDIVKEKKIWYNYLCIVFLTGKCFYAYKKRFDI